MSNDPQYDTTDTTKNAKLLNAARPKSSRVIKENGAVVNIADALTTNDDGDLVIRVVSSN